MSPCEAQEPEVLQGVHGYSRTLPERVRATGRAEGGAGLQLAVHAVGLFRDVPSASKGHICQPQDTHCLTGSLRG
jgi:hypothetical protein